MNREAALFELGRWIVRDHEASTAGRIKVVPVVVDSLEDTRPILEALAAVCEGRLFDTTDPALRRPVEASGEAVLRAAVEKAFSGDPARDIALSIGGGIVDASFRSAPEGSASPGQEVILSVVRAVLHKDLNAFPLSIVAFRETLIDLTFRHALWGLINDHLRDMPNPTLRTLVVVAESAIEVDVHCGARTGFRFAIDANRFLMRQGIDDLRAKANALAKFRKPFVVFLGAGFSASSHMPLGNKVRDDAIKDLLALDAEEPLTSAQLAEKFHSWVSEKSEWMTLAERSLAPEVYIQNLTLEQVIRAERKVHGESPTLKAFKVHHDNVLSRPGSAVLDLCAMLEAGDHRPVIVTVNFDQLLETHCECPLRVFSTDLEFGDAADYVRGYLRNAEADIPLLKVHGTINDPESCVVSTEQTEQGVGQSKLDAIRALKGTRSNQMMWLYVGTSMRDLDLQRVLREEDFARGVDERWVDPFLSEGVEQFAQDRVGHWKGTKLRSIEDRLMTQTADAFFSAVRAALEV